METVEVLWMDSCSSNMNWTVAEDIDIEPMYIDSFGIVVKDTDEFLAIAQNYGNDPEQYSNIITIPKGCIKKVIVIPKDDKCENEQKPAQWSEEDSYMLGQAIKCVNNSGKLDVSTEEIEDWLKSLKGRVQTQPKQEWGERDEIAINAITQLMKTNEKYNVWKSVYIDDGNVEVKFEYIASWLKSLRPNHWKPSKEQLDVLQWAIKHAEQERLYVTQEVLVSLMGELKKLMEE